MRKRKNNKVCTLIDTNQRAQMTLIKASIMDTMITAFVSTKKENNLFQRNISKS